MNEKMKWVAFAILAGVILYAIHKLFKGVGDTVKGVSDTVATTAHDFGIGVSPEATALKTMDAFQPMYWVQSGAKNINTPDTLAPIVEIIFNAVTLAGAYSDDATILGQIKKMTTQAQVSQLAEQFLLTHQTDMLNYFYSPMTNDSLVQLSNFVSALPKK